MADQTIFNYLIIAEESIAEFRHCGSRFIADVYPLNSKEAFKLIKFLMLNKKH